ncbi:MAG TPA: DeoR/GlpR family DNA-binding transcription regulator [Thermotogota bacterium]|nr:DeoR/GlpR family DNA-binding transcription regulator [Thermotogota bacterium]
MSKELRQEKIVQLIMDRDFVSMSDLGHSLGVSTITLRRDIAELVEKGFVEKTYGGIKKASNRVSEARFFERLATNRKEKQMMAREALNLIEDGDILFFDTSTTVFELVLWCCKYRKFLNVVTNGLQTASELLKNPTFNVTVIGGTATSSNFATSGVYAEKMASEIHVRQAFFSCSAFDPQEGSFENVPTTGNIKRILGEKSERRILLADQGKFFRKSIMKTFDVQTLDAIITNLPKEGIPSTLSHDTRYRFATEKAITE